MRASFGWLLIVGCGEPATNSMDDVAPTTGDSSDTEDSASYVPDSVFVPPAPLPNIVINEVMPGNESTLLAEGIADLTDWFELLNTGDEPVQASSLILSNGQGDVWQPPDDVVLEPNAIVLVAASTQPVVGLSWTGWTLDRDGDTLTIAATDGRTIDQFAFGDTDNDLSYARFADGVLQPTARPTPGEINEDAPSATLNPATETVFTTERVHQISFTMSADEYDTLSDFSRPEVQIEVDIDGVALSDVGLKLKGSASYDTMDGKPAFIVDFNEGVSGQRFRGLKAIKLHNGNVLDPTRVRDHITYRLAREAGLMAPRVGWAEVLVDVVGSDGSVTPLYYGIYMVIEKHDDIMIGYHYPESADTGMMFEPNESEGGGGTSDLGGTGDLNWKYDAGPSPIPEGALDHLGRADQIFGGPGNAAAVEELWNHVHKDRFLAYLAWETVVGHTDGYRAPNNWRVYVDGVTGLVELVPAGAEWTWDNQVDVFPTFIGGNAYEWCVEAPACAAPYAEKVVEVADLVDDLGLADEFQQLSEWLDPIIDQDPRYSSFQSVEDARQDSHKNLLEFPHLARVEVFDRYPELRP